MPTKLAPELLDRYSDALQSIANDCRDDPDLRARVDADPRSVFADRGLLLPHGADVRIVWNTNKVFHLAMPPDPNAHLSDTMLEGVAGGGQRRGGIDGVRNSASSASTIPSCLGTFGCATGN